MLKTLPLQYENDTNIFWKKRGKSENNSRVELKKYRTTVTEAVKQLQLQVHKFKRHSYVNRVQTQHFQNIKQTLDGDEIVLQIYILCGKFCNI